MGGMVQTGEKSMVRGEAALEIESAKTNLCRLFMPRWHIAISSAPLISIFF